jgi:hypothetical protein
MEVAVCVVVIAGGANAGIQQYHGTSILSPKLAAAAPNTRPGNSLRKAPLPHMTTTTTTPAKRSSCSSCIMTVVSTYANSHLLNPFHFFTDILEGWQHLNIAFSVACCAFSIVWRETQTTSSPALFALEDQAFSHYTMSATWECLETQSTDTIK